MRRVRELGARAPRRVNLFVVLPLDFAQELLLILSLKASCTQQNISVLQEGT